MAVQWFPADAVIVKLLLGRNLHVSVCNAPISYARLFLASRYVQQLVSQYLAILPLIVSLPVIFAQHMESTREQEQQGSPSTWVVVGPPPEELEQTVPSQVVGDPA